MQLAGSGFLCHLAEVALYVLPVHDVRECGGRAESWVMHQAWMKGPRLAPATNPELRQMVELTEDVLPQQLVCVSVCVCVCLCLCLCSLKGVPCVCVCVYIYMYIYIYIYIHAYTHTHTYIYIYIQKCIYIYIYCVYIYIYVSGPYPRKPYSNDFPKDDGAEASWNI